MWAEKRRSCETPRSMHTALSALNTDVILSIRDAYNFLDASDNVRCLILTGSEKPLLLELTLRKCWRWITLKWRLTMKRVVTTNGSHDVLKPIVGAVTVSL